MGVGRGTGSGAGDVAVTSAREKAGQLTSSLIKLAKGAMEKVRAVFSELKAEGDKVFAKPPGQAKQEVPAGTPTQIDNDQVKLSDILKIGGLSLLSLALGNPVPMIFAQRHAKNLRERIKAREKQEVAARKAAEKKTTKASKTKVGKHDAAIRRLNVLEKKMQIMQREYGAALRGAASTPSRTVTDADRKAMSSVQKQFVRMGYSAKDATAATNVAARRVSPSETQKFMKTALKEVSALHKKS